ncbi:MAG: hypothetical protein DRN25_02070 [Thermoplasmata archaeon]|nr:MAG: hypothetical protein DRN25_02070 [Thermoplasmata archaeon]HDI72719.1 M56 family metallopeptidase [Candidatus Altiarchaeales archaeon]
MNELIVAMLLSISLSFLAFLFSNKMIKLLHINHPRDRFWIYMFALLTAFSIFLIPFLLTKAYPNEPVGGIEINSICDGKSSVLIETENYTTGKLPPFPPKGKIMISRNGHLIFPSMTHSANREGSFTFLPFIPLTLFSVLYLIFGLFLGKVHLLRKLNAERCREPNILRIVEEISKELNIKKPTTFIYDGDPNAFVFGYPACLLISKNLIKCLSEEEIRLVIYHELSHIKNKDTLLKPLLQALRILFFYNPVVHLIFYRIIKERELMADEMYIDSKKDKVTFMSALVKIHEYGKREGRPSISWALAILDYIPKRLSLNERFNNLFGVNRRKFLHTILICSIILLSNLTLLMAVKEISLFDNIERILENRSKPLVQSSSDYTEILVIDSSENTIRITKSGKVWIFSTFSTSLPEGFP